MIISAINKSSAILQNLVDTLSQIRVGGQAVRPLVIDRKDYSLINVAFYVDKEKTELLFQENTTDFPDSFVASQNKTLYSPSDVKLNFTQNALSALFAQKLYYVTITIDSTTVINTSYDNSKNLMFTDVIISTQKNPVFNTDSDTAIIVPTQEDERPAKEAFHSLVIPNYDIYLQITAPNLTNLSEKDRIDMANKATSIMRLALYKDPNRDGNCTFYDQNLDGTYVGRVEVMPTSGKFFNGVCRVQCCYMAANTVW